MYLMAKNSVNLLGHQFEIFFVNSPRAVCNLEANYKNKASLVVSRSHYNRAPDLAFQQKQWKSSGYFSGAAHCINSWDACVPPGCAASTAAPHSQPLQTSG